MNLKQGILLPIVVTGLSCLSVKAVTYDLPSYKEAQVVPLSTPVAEYGNIDITDVRQSIHTPGFHTSLQSAADHLPLNADATNFQINVSKGLFQKNIQTKGVNFFRQPGDFVTYTCSDVHIVKTSEYALVTNGGIVHENASATGTVATQGESNAAPANIQVPAKQRKTIYDKWKQNSTNASAEDEETGTLVKRKIIIDEGDDVPGTTPQPPFVSPVSLGDMPFLLFLLFAAGYVVYRKRIKQTMNL